MKISKHLSAVNFLESVDFFGKPQTKKWAEEDLQFYLIDWYQKQGYKVAWEVTNDAGRADLVLEKEGDRQVIEVKKWLSRDNLLQAKGQVEGYVKFIWFDERGTVFGKPVIIGLLPTRNMEQEEAIAQAQRIEKCGVEVIFVDQEECYYPKATVSDEEYENNWYGSTSRAGSYKIDIELNWKSAGKIALRLCKIGWLLISKSFMALSWFVRKGSGGVGTGSKILFKLLKAIGRVSNKGRYPYRRRENKKLNWVLIWLGIAVLGISLDAGSSLFEKLEQQITNQGEIQRNK